MMFKTMQEHMADAIRPHNCEDTECPYPCATVCGCKYIVDAVIEAFTALDWKIMHVSGST